MNDRQIKMPAKKKTAIREEEDVEIVSQRQKPDVGRYLLQVDRQSGCAEYHNVEENLGYCDQCGIRSLWPSSFAVNFANENSHMNKTPRALPRSNHKVAFWHHFQVKDVSVACSL